MKFYMTVLSIVLFIVVSISAFIILQKEPINIGIIHSQTGTMAMFEKDVLDATLLGIEQINIAGGLLGRKVEAVVVDGKSTDKGFEDGVRKLLDAGVTTIFGGWTSSSRKAMKIILEEENALLFYPIQYEGFESSKNIFYLGLLPNQQVLPTLNYAVENFGNSAFLVGSEYIYPKITNKFIESIAGYANVNIVGEEYKLLGENNFSDVVEKIKLAKPSFIVNTLNGDSNVAFFKALNQSGISLYDTPVFSFSITEAEMYKIAHAAGIKSIEGSYLTWSYFNSLQTKENIELKNLFKKRFAKEVIITDPMYSAYMGVKLFANAVKKYNSFETAILKNNILKESIGGAAGIISMDAKNSHAWREVHIAKLSLDGVAKVVWSSQALQEPKPFPEYTNANQMLEYEEELYKKWGNRYEASRELK